MRAYYNLIEGLWRLGEYREALGYLEQAENFGRDRDFRVYGYMFAARRCPAGADARPVGARPRPGCGNCWTGRTTPA